jgi:hypothetical protein
MNSALRNQVIIDLKNAILPIIAKKFAHIHLNDLNADDRSMGARISDINTYINNLNPAQYNIEFVGGSTIRVTGRALSMRVLLKPKLGV